MKDNQRVLIFPGGTEDGLEYQRSLCHVRHIELYGAASVPTDHGAFVYARYATDVPFADSDNFISCLSELLDRWRIDAVLPAHDSVVLALAEAGPRIGAKIITSPVETCRICRSKQRTYEHLQGLVRSPHLFASAGDVGKWPVFLKPDVGQGSSGVRLAHTAEEVDFFLREDPSLLLLDYLGGTEFTVDCFTDRFGELQFVGARERVCVTGGISTNTRTIQDAALTGMAQAINGALRFRGMWFFQAKKNEQGDLVLLEVSPRLAGGAGLHRNLGVNLPLLSLYDAWDIDVQIARNEGDLEMDRSLQNRFRSSLSYEHVYVDLDDCLILAGKVNTQLVAFLFQCLNRGLGLHLLTRHTQAPHETLRQVRLDGVFDSVQHVDDGRGKSEYIIHANAIFIDDSFSEREEVRQQSGVPVFSPDAVESLLQQDVAAAL